MLPDRYALYALICLSCIKFVICDRTEDLEYVKHQLNDRRKLRRNYTPKLLNVKKELFGKHTAVPLVKRSSGSSTTQKMSREFMLHLYNNLVRGQGLVSASGHWSTTLGLTMSDTVRSVPATDRSSDIHEDILHFTIPTLPKTEILHQAELRFRSRTNGGVTIVVKRGNTVVRELPVLRKSVSKDYDIIFDITKHLSPWVNSHRGNVSIEVRKSAFSVRRRSKTEKDRKTRSAFYSDSGKVAILILYSKDSDFFKKIQSDSSKTSDHSDTALFRGKRATNKRRQTSKRLSNKTSRRKRICQVRDFEVDFNQIGWGKWIIIPKRFNSKICQGSCPAPIHADLTPTNHALLQSLMRVNNLKKRPPMPCCVPTKFKPLSMLYYEESEVVVRYHQNMIVEKCGCR